MPPGSRPLPRLISIVVPVHNCADVIENQLEALSRQTYQGDFEIVVVDNRSTDGLREKSASWHGRFPRVRLVSGDDGTGVSYARNVGWRASRGDLICICDADDMVSDQWLELMAIAATAFDLVGGGLMAHPDDPVRPLPWRSRTAWSQMPHHMRFLPYVHGCNIAVWRAVIEALNGWNEELKGGGDDIDFSWRAQLSGFTIGYEARALVAYKQRDTIRGLARQVYNYGRADAALLRRFRTAGARRASTRAVLKGWWWILSRAPLAIADQNRRGWWVARSAAAVGRLRGSVDHKTWCP